MDLIFCDYRHRHVCIRYCLFLSIRIGDIFDFFLTTVLHQQQCLRANLSSVICVDVLDVTRIPTQTLSWRTSHVLSMIWLSYIFLHWLAVTSVLLSMSDSTPIRCTRTDVRDALHIQTYWHPRLVGLLQHNALVLLTRRITRTG